jgi:hypothetical protein
MEADLKGTRIRLNLRQWIPPNNSSVRAARRQSNKYSPIVPSVRASPSVHTRPSVRPHCADLLYLDAAGKN